MNNLDKELNKCLEIEADAVPVQAESIGENLLILGYEFGAVCEDYIHITHSKDEDTVRARAANSIVELSDLVTQALISFAKLKKRTRSLSNMTVEEFIVDGLERQQHHMREEHKGMSCREIREGLRTCDPKH